MVGGTIIEFMKQDGRIWLNVQDKTYKDECGIYVVRDENSEKVTIGDSVWWQGSKVFWTPTGNDVVDFPLERASYSGADRPPLKE